MSVLTPGQIIDVLARKEPDQLLGAVETDQVDFKLAPYHLGEDYQKWELAKDIAAFANNRGGVIVIGVRTRTEQNEIIETAVEISPVPKNIVDLQQYRGVIDRWIYPRAIGIDLRWYPPDANEDRGLLVVEVPAQHGGAGPFILQDMRDPDSNFKGAIGIPRRDRERILWDSAADIHRQITRSAVTLESSRTSETNALERAQARINSLEEQQGWTGRPTYFLQALAPDGTEIADFHKDIRRILTGHQILRNDGFAPWQNFDIDVFERGWLAHRSDIVTLLEPDGLLTHGTLISENTYLGWYYNDRRTPDNPLVLHPIAVVETTLEFFRFLHLQILPRTDGRPWQHRISCRRFRSNNVALPAGHPKGHIFFNAPIAKADEWTSNLQETTSPGRDAFLELQSLYMLFGHTSNVIPLVQNDLISENALVNLPSW
jgi:hypothetical protein